MQKELVLQFHKEKLLLLHSVSNYTLTIIERLSQCLPSPESPGFLNCCSLPGSSKEVISHNASLLLSPRFSISDAPFLGAPRRWSVSSIRSGSRTWLETSPVALPDPAAIPGELFGPSNESSWGLAIWKVRTLVPKRTWNTIRWHASHSSQGSFSPAWPSHQSWLRGPAWLESRWALQKRCRNQ